MLILVMARHFRITLNRDALRANRAREEKRAVSDAEIDKWLIEAGFRKDGDAWIVREEDLGHLDPSEVNSAEEHELH